MAAPSTVYLGKKFTNHLSGVVKLDSYPALKLSEYGNSIRELFYLHLLLIVKNGNEVGFLGLVEDNLGNPYYQMHAASRFSKIKIKHPNGKIYVALNDAGLNTKGFASITSGEAVFGTGPRVMLSYVAAYWVDTDGISLEFKLQNESTWHSISVKGAMPQRSANSELVAFNNATTPIQPNDIVNVRALHSNAEDVYPSVVYTFQVPTPSALFATEASAASAAYSNWQNATNPYQYKFSSFTLAVGTIVFLQNNSPAGIGYYANGTSWFKTATNGLSQTEIVAVGTVGSWPSDDPATQPTYGTVSWYHRAANTWQNACALISGGSHTTYTTYVRSSDSVHFLDTAFSNKANGIYYNSSTTFVEIVNGVITQEGDCTNGWHLGGIE